MRTAPVLWSTLRSYEDATRTQDLAGVPGVYVLYVRLPLTSSDELAIPFYFGVAEHCLQTCLFDYTADSQPIAEIGRAAQDGKCSFAWGLATPPIAHGLSKYLYDTRPMSCREIADPGGLPIEPDPLPPNWPPGP